MQESWIRQIDDIYQALKQTRRQCIPDLSDCESETGKTKATASTLQACRSHQYPLIHVGAQGKRTRFKNPDCAACELGDSNWVENTTCLLQENASKITKM